MCWNQYVSINTFIFSIFVLIFIAVNNKYSPYKIKEFDSIFVYLFFVSFVLMQLIEFFIWRNLKNEKMNKLFSILGAFLLIIQPIASLMMLKNNILKMKMIVIYSIPAFTYFIYQLKYHNFYTEVSKSGHLKWVWSIPNNKISIPVIFYLYFLMYSVFKNKHYLLITYSIALLLLSYYLYVKDDTVTSIWCWSVNTLMLYFAFKLLILLPVNEHGFCLV
jgi:hypothetical protein